MRSTIAFSRNSVLNSQISFESADVTAGRPNKKPLDPRQILDIGETLYSFSPDFDWNGENHPRLDFWSHELVVSAHAFFPAPPQDSRKPSGKNSRRASTERTIVPLMESVLRTDPAVRLALAADRVLLVKWAAGFFPGLPFDRSDVCAARFAVWDASENTFIKVGNPAAIAVLALALRTRNLSVRTQGTLNFAREFPIRLDLPSATLAAALKHTMVKGGQGIWRKHRGVLNYLGRLGLTDLANELKTQADAPARILG